MFRLVLGQSRRVFGQPATLASLASKYSHIQSPRAISSSISKKVRTSIPSFAADTQITKLWQQAEAVCFDVDCTITKQDAIDDLGEFLGKGEACRKFTEAVRDGTMDVEDALERRLEIMEPTVDKLTAYIESNPAEKRLVPGVKELIEELQARGVQIYLVSSGFRELILPIADLLKIPRENIFANRFAYAASEDDPKATFPKIRVKSYDPEEPTSRKGGKPEAIRRIRAMHGVQTVVMVGDGITDLEAVEETGGADLFIGYGGVVPHEKVREKADWYVTDYQQLHDTLPRLKVAMVGSGAFASAAMQMVSVNAKKKPLFEDRVDMYVYEEEYEGGKLTDAINREHANPKYLPGVHFGDNVVANPSLEDTVKDADLIIFCAPHQYMPRICKQIQLKTKPTAMAISLIKGIHITPKGPALMSSMVRDILHINCSVLMGANLASEILPGGLCEATIGSHSYGEGQIFQELFDTEYFSTTVINDVEGAELAGALKNVVAVAAGFADGCKLGENAKATILRQGLYEMRLFAKSMYSTVSDETFFENCGVADLIATCYGGRNHRVSKAYAELDGSKTFAELEADLLRGQKLQGVLTSHEVRLVIESRGWEKVYPLFTAVDSIVRRVYEPKDIARFREIAESPNVRVDPVDEPVDTVTVSAQEEQALRIEAQVADMNRVAIEKASDSLAKVPMNEHSRQLKYWLDQWHQSKYSRKSHIYRKQSEMHQPLENSQSPV